MQYSVPATSLSIVLGIATSGTPSSNRTREKLSVSSPPIVTRTSSPSRSMLSRTTGVRSTTPSLSVIAATSAGSNQAGNPLAFIRLGFVRDVWSQVPPVRSIVRVFDRSRVTM